MELIKITPDKEKANSILNMSALIEKRIKLQDRQKMAALIVADYYEIIKELITVLLLVDGYKTLSHKNLVSYLESNYSVFTDDEIVFLNNLRILRNRIAYEGFSVEKSYLTRREKYFIKIIGKLKKLVGDKL